MSSDIRECSAELQEDLDSVAGERDVWYTMLSLLPPRPDPG